jgi:hypothetical protein
LGSYWGDDSYLGFGKELEGEMEILIFGFKNYLIGDLEILIG